MKIKSRKVFENPIGSAVMGKLWSGGAGKISFSIIILGYMLVPNFTPHWMALDNNSSKFMSLAVVNLLTFLLLFFDKNIKQKPEVLFGFFRPGPGLALAGLLLMTLLSFVSAINRIESVVELSKFVSVFAAVFVVSIILSHEIRYVRMITVVLAGILIFDSMSVYYNIGEFIQGNIQAIPDIKSIYSNKNILAAVIFVKIPAALWLVLYEKNSMKQLGITAMFCGFLSTFFLATRAFYLGLVVFTLLFCLYSLYNYYREREKKHIHLLVIYLVALTLALGVFTLIRANFYPASGSRHTQGVGQQLHTIVAGDLSTRFRFETWIWSVEMIKNNPFLGVGAGNWKVAVLEYENRTKPDFSYAYTSHNDFLETTAECGLLGGGLYLAIYGTVFWSFLRLLLGSSSQGLICKSLFFAATGMFFFSIDAFFNFPGDRPEMLALLALYLGGGIAAINVQERETENECGKTASPQLLVKVPSKLLVKVPSSLKKMVVGLFIAVLLAIVYIFYLNFESSKLQRLVYIELQEGYLKEPADKFLAGFPVIPNVSHWGESVSTLKGRYLIQEQRFNEALKVMEKDLLNPFDGTREYLMAICFLKMEMFDEALDLSQKSFAVKPNYFHNFQLMIEMLEKTGETRQAIDHLEAYLRENKSNINAWIMLTNDYYHIGNVDRAYELIEEAVKVLPENPLINRQRNFLAFRKLAEPHRHLFDTAMSAYKEGNFLRSVRYVGRYINNVPSDSDAYQMRAMAYYELHQFQNAIEDIERMIELGVNEDSLTDLRKACDQELARNEGNL